MRQQLEELARHITAHADQPLPLADLAARLGWSPTHLQKRFKELFGVSPKVYQDAIRLRRLKQALRRGQRVTDAIYEAGYGSASRVHTPARTVGMSWKHYARGGVGETLSYAGCESRLGPLLMAASDRGVCFAEFGDTQGDLERALAEEFPHATRVPAADSAELRHWLQALDEALRCRGPSPQLPLDLRGTAFQIRVWRFLLGLERGQTLSYGQLAAAIEAPRAVRAVAGACARNRIAVLVPCHRVLRNDGGLGGYRWGLARKAHLLESEVSPPAG